MKKLFIVRHSKAVEYASDHSDFNRCLAPYGIEKATRIARHLAKQEKEPDLLISSPACRALETAKIFSKAYHYPEENIQLHEPLYHFGGIERALNLIEMVDDSAESVFIFGHNPTFNALAWHLARDFHDAMPTCAVVGISFDTSHWMEVPDLKGKLIAYVTKRRL